MQSHSENLAEIGAAMALAQAEIEGASKDADNPFFKTKYATLASVWEACKPALTKNGLSVLQFSEPSEHGTLALVTMLLHKSGQFIVGTETLPLAKNDPQGYGSAITYARRYGLAAMVGVCPEDDDAQAATAPRTAPKPRTAPSAPAAPLEAPSTRYEDMTPSTASETGRKWFFAKVKEETGLDSKQAYALLTVKSLSEEMPDHTFGQILGFIKLAQQRQLKAASMAN